jgi:hypothetical protein
MVPKRATHRQQEEIPLAHDASTWDEDIFDSVWDGETDQVVDELTRSADGWADFTAR